MKSTSTFQTKQARQQQSVSASSSTSCCDWKFGEAWPSTICPKFKNVQQEVMNNEFAPISRLQWNDAYNYTRSLFNSKGGSVKKERLSKILHRYKIKMKHILAIKLYSDHDSLQTQLRLCFVPLNCLHTTDRKELMSSFFHWYKLLREAFKALSRVPALQEHTSDCLLYHGVRCESMSAIAPKESTYYGPLSTTTELNVAMDFAGSTGTVLVLEALDSSAYRPIDISVFSLFGNEKEIMLLDQKISVLHDFRAADYETATTLVEELVADKKQRVHQQRLSELKSTLDAVLRSDCTMREEDSYLQIGSSQQKTSAASCRSLVLNELNAGVCVLGLIYRCALSFAGRMRREHEAERKVHELLKNKILSIEMRLYDKFLSMEEVNGEKCTRVLSHYIQG